MGLLGVWNMSFMGYNSRSTLPYAEALLKLPAHIQQLDMEVSLVTIVPLSDGIYDIDIIRCIIFLFVLAFHDI